MRMKVYRRQIMQDLGGLRIVTLEFSGCECKECVDCKHAVFKLDDVVEGYCQNAGLILNSKAAAAIRANMQKEKQTMTNDEAADKAKRIAENLSGYAADFYGLERRIRCGAADSSDVTYELKALVEELESLIDEVNGTLKELE